MEFVIEKITASNKNTTSVVKLVNKVEKDRGILGKKIISNTYYMGGMVGAAGKEGDKVELDIAEFDVVERGYTPDGEDAEIMCKWLHEKR